MIDKIRGGKLQRSFQLAEDLRNSPQPYPTLQLVKELSEFRKEALEATRQKHLAEQQRYQRKKSTRIR